MKKYYLVAVFISLIQTTSAFAGWVQDSVIIDTDTKDVAEISRHLPLFGPVLNQLNALNLTAESKVKVQRFVGKLVRYRWENDETCKVENPDAVEDQILLSSLSEYIYMNNPEDIWNLEVYESIGVPCGGSVKSAKSTNTRK